MSPWSGSVASAQTFSPVPKTSPAHSSPATAGQTPPAASLRPVPKFSGTSVRDPQRGTASSDKTTALVWRKSEQVAPPAPVMAAPVKVAAQRPLSLPNQLRANDSDSLQLTAPTGTPLTQHGSNAPPEVTARTLTPSNSIRPNSIRQAQFELPAPGQAAVAPTPADLPRTLQSPAQAQPSKPLPDFFEEPFGDTEVPVPAPRTAAGAPPATSPALNVPDLPLPNALRQPAAEESPALVPELFAPSVDPVDESLPPPKLEPAPLPAPDRAIPDPAISPALPNLGGQTQSPSRLGEPSTPGADRIRREVDDLDTRNPRSRSGDGLTQRNYDDVSLGGVTELSCDDFRRNIAQATIRTISLDISPPFRPNEIDTDKFERLRSSFLERQVSRDWTSLDGKKLGRGRLRDLAYEKVLIETDFGTVEEFPVSALAEADLAYVTDQWELPKECLIEQVAYQPRQWVDSKITWKASNLMHNTLYFEEVNSERYGQTPGPILEPIVSSAHFFANIAVMPYKMGVHKPSECQYALGYYRPGDCAPWIIPPVPISLRGALYQAGAITGTFLLVP